MRTGNSLLILAGSAGLAFAASGLVHSPTTGAAIDAATGTPQFGELDLPVSAIFAQGTTPRQMQESYKKLLKKYGVGLEHMLTSNSGLEFVSPTRWPGPVGTPVNLTYSFPPDGTNTNGNGPSSLFATMNSKIGPTATWKALFAQALNAWGGTNSGNTYTEVTDDGAGWPSSPGSASRGDLRIVSAAIDGPGSVLAFNFFPTTGDMLLDEADNWGQGAPSYLFFRNVVTHELGHGNGLSHSCPANGSKLLEPFINLGIVGPQLDDRLSIQFQYGDAQEPNNSLGAATSLDAMGLTSNVQLAINDLSIHSTTDGDMFSFVANAGSVITQVVAAPAGNTYLAGAQNGNGSCQPGTPYAALSQFDLILELLNSAGAVLATSNANGIGLTETLSGVALVVDDTYVIRVRANGGGASPTPIQPYRLTATINLTSLVGDINGDGAVNAADLAALLASWGAAGGGTNADLDGNGIVDAGDLATLLANWTG